MGATRAEGEEMRKWGDLTGSWQTYTIWAPKWYEPFCRQGLGVREVVAGGSGVRCEVLEQSEGLVWFGANRKPYRLACC
jgi:hypothetical protein